LILAKDKVTHCLQLQLSSMVTDNQSVLQVLTLMMHITLHYLSSTITLMLHTT